MARIPISNESNNDAKPAEATEPADVSEVEKLKKELASLKIMLAERGNMVSTEDAAAQQTKAITEALKLAIPAAAAGIAQANNQSVADQRDKLVRAAQKKLRRCACCNLPETACGGPYKLDEKGEPILEKNEDGSPKFTFGANHVKAYVGPKDEDLLWHFRYAGFRITNVVFMSDYYGHQIWIPKKSDILTLVNNWERNEKELTRKRTGEGRGMRSAGGSMHNYGYAPGWR